MVIHDSDRKRPIENGRFSLQTFERRDAVEVRLLEELRESHSSLMALLADGLMHRPVLEHLDHWLLLPCLSQCRHVQWGGDKDRRDPDSSDVHGFAPPLMRLRV